MAKGRWVKPRKKIASYPKTGQQKTIGEAGKKIGEECKGLKGKEFLVCRSEILEKIFTSRKTV